MGAVNWTRLRMDSLTKLELQGSNLVSGKADAYWKMLFLYDKKNTF